MSNAELAPSFSIESVASQLNGIKKGDKYSCLCPAHPDTKPSLSVSLSDTGKILFYCHAGCSQQQVLTALRNRGIMPQAHTSSSNNIIETYLFELNGEVLFEKQRKESKDRPPKGDKKFTFRRKVNGAYIYKEVLKGLPEIPLYNLTQLQASPNEIVYIPEGERKVNALKNHSLLAVCNESGAGKWRSSFNKHLENRDIVILQDNDEPGEKHTQLLLKNLKPVAKSIKVVTFPNELKGYDCLDYLQEFGIEKLVEYIEANKASIDSTISEPLPAESKDSEPKKEKESGKESKPKKEKKKTPEARRCHYEDLFKKVLGDVRVDIFSEALVYFHKRKNYWEFARPALEIVRSDAAELEADGILRFSRPLFKDHLAKFQDKMTPELLVNIPKWDGKDHIKLMADCLNPSPTQGFLKSDFDNLISDWIVKAYKRVFDPNVRNRILILKGKQDKGKDWWIDSLLFGAEQFLKDMHLINADKDAFLQLSEAWFLKIGEFDKTARTEVSVLKDMITKPFTDLRAPYDEGKKRRYSRCSFISASNINDILRDPTGASRYMILELDDENPITYNYPVRNKEFGLQVLAQAKALAESGFQCPIESERKLEIYLKERTPSDPSEDVPQLYWERLPDYICSLSIEDIIKIKTTGRLTFSQIQPFLVELSKMLEIRTWTIQNILNSKRVAQKIGGNKFYLAPESLDEGFKDSIDEATVYDDQIPF